MRSIRGLYVIRSGGVTPTLTAPPVRADSGDVPDDGRLGTLVVDFSRFNSWYEINSFWEGRFIERTARGSFKKTIAERGSQVKVLFNHGMEFNEGDKLLGPIEVLEERATSPHMEVALLDAPFARNLAPGLRAKLYGSSFMFEVLGETWNREPERSEHNPEGLPERTITEVRLLEAGPVTWPANPAATAGLRSASGTDWLVEQLQQRDKDLREDLLRSLAGFRAMNGLRTPDEGAATPDLPAPSTPAPGTEPVRHVDGISKQARDARLRAILLENRRRTDADD